LLICPKVQTRLGAYFMTNTANASIDDILKSIREAIINKEQKKYFSQFLPQETKKETEDEIFELSRSMIVNREDIPYQLGVWNFDDVAKKIMKKYKTFFAGRTAARARLNDNMPAAKTAAHS